MKPVVTTTILLILSLTSLFSQSGKISGYVSDASTKEPLIGANIIIPGTTIGAATDIEGFFVILNVPPGNYELRASMIGYKPQVITNVRVNINQTTELKFELPSELIETEVVVVTAKTPVVQKDVSASTVNINVKQIENLPVTSVSAVVSLQAGIQGGLVVRGGASNQTAFMLNGMTLRDERDNTPYTGVSLTAVEEIQVQTGGFNAEYGNIRSGLINVVTKEGKTDKYSVNVITRISPPTRKFFGDSPNSRNSFWIRPYVDDAVAWTGTENGAWDKYTQRQYPKFEGWNSIAAKTLLDNDPNNDLTPLAAQKLFLFQHRKVTDPESPDYDIDLSIAGPFPFVSKELGNLRFLLAFRAARENYIIPLSRTNYNDYNIQFKLTSDLQKGMKITFDGLLGKAQGTNNNNEGLPGIFRSPESIASLMSRVSYIDTRIFASDYWAPSIVDKNLFGAKFTHVLSPSSFYEIYLSRFSSSYNTNPGRPRDTSKVFLFGNSYYVDEGPYGWFQFPSNSIEGMRMGVGMSNSRDSSKVAVYTLRADFNSQLDKYNNIKAGVEFVYTDNQVNYGSVDIYLPSGRSNSRWNSTPTKGAFYVQDKLEFEGMIANLGLRLDYSHAGGEWYVFDPYNKAFASEFSLGIDTILSKQPTDKIVNLSPRLGIAFPITVSSKLYFNYGHFRSMPTPENLYLIRRFSDNNAVTRIASPNNPLPKTVAYELGYEQSLFDEYLIRVAGYYKDVTFQPNLVRYTSRDNKVNYQITQSNSYEDIRGFELTLSKNRGNWVQGFINYTYMVSTSGYFGFGQYYENPADQRRYERETRFNYQERPVPRPYARLNIDFFSPREFGPEIAGIYPFEELAINLLGSWSSGFYFTWVGGGSIPGIVNNVQWNDYWNFDMRITKNIRFSGVNLQLFADISNLFNFKYMSQYGFFDGPDYENYMKSLHLPAEVGDRFTYINIPGKDNPGDYRIKGPYVPIEAVVDVNSVAVNSIVPTAIYWDKATGKYMQYVNNDWVEVDGGRMKEILDNKQYIDMPNQGYFTFLNPRNIYFGVKLSFELF